MTKELRQILDNFKAEINNWNAGVVTNEAEFLGNLKKLSAQLGAELSKPQPEEKTIKE